MSERKRQTEIAGYFNAATARVEPAQATFSVTTIPSDSEPYDQPRTSSNLLCDTSDFDIGLHVGKSVDRATKERVMKSVWSPDSSYSFQADPKRRLKWKSSSGLPTPSIWKVHFAMLCFVWRNDSWKR